MEMENRIKKRQKLVKAGQYDVWIMAVGLVAKLTVTPSSALNYCSSEVDGNTSLIAIPF